MNQPTESHLVIHLRSVEPDLPAACRPLLAQRLAEYLNELPNVRARWHHKTKTWRELTVTADDVYNAYGRGELWVAVYHPAGGNWGDAVRVLDGVLHKMVDDFMAAACVRNRPGHCR
jgi:hypothetical protein